jgi:hypothetical protein
MAGDDVPATGDRLVGDLRRLGVGDGTYALKDPT